MEQEQEGEGVVIRDTGLGLGWGLGEVFQMVSLCFIAVIMVCKTSALVRLVKYGSFARELMAASVVQLE